MNTRAPWRMVGFCLLALFTMNCGGGSNGSTGTTRPAVPSMVMAVLAEPMVVVVSWQDNSSNEQGFLIERQAGAGEFKEIGRTAANVTEFRDPTVSLGRQYFYRVAALDNQMMGTGFAEDTMVDVPR